MELLQVIVDLRIVHLATAADVLSVAIAEFLISFHIHDQYLEVGTVCRNSYDESRIYSGLATVITTFASIATASTVIMYIVLYIEFC